MSPVSKSAHLLYQRRVIRQLLMCWEGLEVPAAPVVNAACSGEESGGFGTSAWGAESCRRRVSSSPTFRLAGSYHAVRRFVRRRHGKVELPFRRMECLPGQELQVDFGQGAWVLEHGKRRRTHLFRVVLSHSRKGYSEPVWRQTSESFIRCLPVSTDGGAWGSSSTLGSSRVLRPVTGRGPVPRSKLADGRDVPAATRSPSVSGHPPRRIDFNDPASRRLRTAPSRCDWPNNPRWFREYLRRRFAHRRRPPPARGR